MLCRQCDLGSMLWWQFSAIFPIFVEKNLVFLKNQCYDPFFCKRTSSSFEQKRQLFRQICIYTQTFLKSKHKSLKWFLKKLPSTISRPWTFREKDCQYVMYLQMAPLLIRTFCPRNSLWKTVSILAKGSFPNLYLT
jgi:hypothetical protein